MTCDYLAGELSRHLEAFQSVSSRGFSGELARLRRQAETLPVSALASVVVRALELADLLCWDCLQNGDSALFTREIQMCTDLHLFGVCSRLLEDP